MKKLLPEQIYNPSPDCLVASCKYYRNKSCGLDRPTIKIVITEGHFELPVCIDYERNIS